MSTYISLFYVDVLTYPCPKSVLVKLILISKLVKKDRGGYYRRCLVAVEQEQKIVTRWSLCDRREALIELSGTH